MLAVFRYGKLVRVGVATIVDSVQTWEISACGLATLVGSVQTGEISACGVAILVGRVKTWGN